MSQTSNWWEIDEVFELNEEGVISLALRELSFLDYCYYDASCEFEKVLINKAKVVLGDIIQTVMKSKCIYSEEIYEKLMEIIHLAVKGVIDFSELVVLN